MRNVILLWMLLLTLMVTACGDRTESLRNGLPSTSALPDTSTTGSKLEEKDDAIRAIGNHVDGRLLVIPTTKVKASPLGAPSCWGLETDFRWSGDYELVWESKSGEHSTKVMKFPMDFEIVQPNDSPIEMQQFTLEGTDIFAFVPRYTDCHALETYLYGVSNNEAFPISFEINSDEIWTHIGQLSSRSLQAINGELIVTGGYGAGQDFIEIYHFQYDLMKKTMVLKSTDYLQPNDILK
ncbi:hypothetical protein [Paenibacillus wynnii]|uniref:Lipoprotein n=1 Tax=Paenibacillus wynnii TaxID=268407 RepID=A0A098M9L4_9BACL|nr:hypothetical protein [Paenibacillus wynnii]KGE19240.1 hypothetical protein PWYN_07650 [Paenibacillus wynnii]